MNSKVEKKIRKHAEKLMVEWLQTILPDEEKEKVSVENISFIFHSPTLYIEEVPVVQPSSSL